MVLNLCNYSEKLYFKNIVRYSLDITSFVRENDDMGNIVYYEKLEISDKMAIEKQIFCMQQSSFTLKKSKAKIKLYTK